MTVVAGAQMGAQVYQPVQAPTEQRSQSDMQFSDAMAQAQKNNANNNTASKSQPETKTARSTDGTEKKQSVTDDRQNVKNGQETQKVKDTQKAQDAQPSDKAASDDDLDKAAETVQEIIGAIADQLSVTQEDVTDAMEVLGLSIMDLLSQGNMAALTAQLSGVDSVELLTSEPMLDSVMELTANVEDVTAQLADMLGIDQQELTELFQQLSGQETAQAEDISFAGQALEEPVQTMQDEGSGVPVIVEETVQEPQRSREETTGETVKDVQAEPQQTAESSTDAVTVQAQETGTEKKQTSQDKEEKGQNLSQQPQTFSQNTVQTQNVVQEASVERFDMERTQDIIDQIADYVKIHNSEQVSSMEIQLNPANLGTVNLQVVSKEGTISAQLTAQDEAVRAALESQVTQLKEALEAQGLKIDAVEVTVASHAFEQNLEQQDRQEEEAEKSSARKSGRRLLDLDELSGDGEDVLDEMSDADRLQAEMMRMGGNRLNYQV